MDRTKPENRSTDAGRVPRRRLNPWTEYTHNPSMVLLLGEIRSALRGCATVLDVGCGNASPMRYVRVQHLLGVDGYAPSLDAARQQRTHDEFVLGDVKQLQDLFPQRRFDACVGFDVIEHLHKEDGWKLLAAMERLATRRVIISTPNGFLPQKSQHGDLQEHVSGWTAAELRSRDYRVIGMFGPKWLRGEYHRILRQPRALWLVASLAMHYLRTRAHPELASAIFCVKDVTDPARQSR